MKALLSAFSIAASISMAAMFTPAWAEHAGIAGDYVCKGPGCGQENELDTITIDEGLFPLVTCYSPTAGLSVGIFTSLNVFTCYGSAVADSNGVYFRLAGFHWYKLRPPEPVPARAIRKQRIRS